MNSKQARTARREDPHAVCRREYNLVQGWLRSSREDNDLLEEANRRLKRDVRQWKEAALGLAFTVSIAYGLWLIWPAFN